MSEAVSNAMKQAREAETLIKTTMFVGDNINDSIAKKQKQLETIKKSLEGEELLKKFNDDQKSLSADVARKAESIGNKLSDLQDAKELDQSVSSIAPSRLSLRQQELHC